LPVGSFSGIWSAALRMSCERIVYTGEYMSLTRRSLLLGSSLPLLAQRRREAAPPNIVLIIADDLASWMVGCYGNKEIRTPNIDTLARAGTRFANNFCCTPVCSA